MTAAETFALLTQHATIYGHNSSQRVDELIQANDALTAMLQTQKINPTAAAAERIALHLTGMQRAANLLIVVLMKETNK